MQDVNLPGQQKRPGDNSEAPAAKKSKKTIPDEDEAASNQELLERMQAVCTEAENENY